MNLPKTKQQLNWERVEDLLARRLKRQPKWLLHAAMVNSEGDRAKILLSQEDEDLRKLPWRIRRGYVFIAPLIRGELVCIPLGRMVLYRATGIFHDPETMHADHRNFNTFDNQRSNLRWLDRETNIRLQKNRSQFPGCIRYRPKGNCKPWSASVKMRHSSGSYIITEILTASPDLGVLFCKAVSTELGKLKPLNLNFDDTKKPTGKISGWHFPESK